MKDFLVRAFSRSGPFWTFAQYGTSRAAVALKFLALAHILGPKGIGLIGVGLLALAIAESLSELGLMHALIQYQGTPSKAQIGSVWGWQLLRTLTVGILLTTLAWPFSKFVDTTGALAILLLVGPFLFFRGASNIELTLQTRALQMRKVSIFNTCFVMTDAILGVVFAMIWKSVFITFLVSVMVEMVRCLLSYKLFDIPLKPSLSSDVSAFTKFGRWIWVNNVLTLILAQLDKIVIIKLLGVRFLGTYQIAQRFAQLGVMDVGTMTSQYMFPKLASQMRSNRIRAIELTVSLLIGLASLGVSVAFFLISFSKPLFAAILGSEWNDSVPTFNILVVAMFGGLLLSVLIPMAKAEGKAWLVTLAAGVQLIVLLFALYYKRNSGLTGIAWSFSIAVWAALFVLMIAMSAGIKKFFDYVKSHYKIVLLIAFVAIEINLKTLAFYFMIPIIILMNYISFKVFFDTIQNKVSTD